MTTPCDLPPGAKPHPWNRDFHWRSPTGPLRVLDPSQAEQFDRDGYVVLEGVFDASEMADITAAIDPFDAETEAFLRRQEHGRFMILETGAITFSVHLVQRSDRLRSFALSSAFVGLCADLIGPDANLYWDQAVYKNSEKPRRFPWHQDNGYTYVEPQQYLTCWLALTDATVDNGCPWVVPGVHRHGTLRHRYVNPLGYECFEHATNAVAAPVGAGGVVVFSSLTPHLTGPNTTGAVRKSYILQYAPLGARVLEGDPTRGPATGEKLCDDAAYQFPVLRAGKAAEP